MIKWINRVTICTILSSLNFRCVSSYFATPNDVFLKPATIYFDNGTEKTGEITIQFANAANSKRFVTLFHREINQSENINVDSIKCYRIKNDYYVPKKIDLNFDGAYHFLFVKRLTEENSRIHLYELHQAYKSTSTGEDRKLYFISLPLFSKYEVWSTYSKHLFPDFANKMSQALSNCPALADKIRSRTTGYFIPNQLFPDVKKMEVYKRIIAEYNSCH